MKFPGIDEDPRLVQVSPDPDGRVVWVLGGIGVGLVLFTACVYGLALWLA